jgi:hypothetical protein
MRRIVACVAASLGLAVASTARAQTSERSDVLSAIELRTGGTSGFGSTAGGPPSIGVALELRPWSALGRRVSIYAAGDFRHHNRHEIFDEEFNVRARVGRSAFLLGGALGVDLVRTAHLTLTTRIGATFVRDYGTYEVGSGIAGFVNDPFETWEPVCAFAPYNQRCAADYALTGTAAVGVRYSPTRNGSFYVGGDYTRLVRGQNVIVAVIGVR